MAVLAHFEQNPFTPEELNGLQHNQQEKLLANPFVAYGATCLLAFLCGNFLYLMQLGDGDIRVHKNGKFIAPMPVDGRLCCGVTTSLCDDNAVANIRDCVMELDNVRYCWLSSDGVLNSFCDEESFNAFISTVRKEYVVESRSAFIDEIKDYLPKLSRLGSGDDLSIACICKKKMLALR